MEPDYKSYSLDELQDALAHIDGQAWPERRLAIEREIADRQSSAPTVNISQTEPSICSTFSFDSNLYERFLWGAVLLVLAIDVLYGMPDVIARWEDLPAMSITLAVLEFAMRLGVIVMLIAGRGPLEVFVYIWGGLWIIKGSLHLLVLLPKLESASFGQFTGPGFYLIVGILLVAPLGKVLKRPMVET